MKKTLTLFMASLFVAGAMAQTEEAMFFSSGNPAWGQAFVENSTKAEDVSIHYRAKWSAYTIIGKSNAISPNDYKGIKIAYEYAEGSNVAVQFDINGKQYSPISMEATEVTLEFNEGVKALETIDALNLQQSGDGMADFTVKSATLIKADDTEEKVTAFDGSHNTALMAGPLTFNAKWAGSIIKDAAGADARFDITAGETHTYVVEFAEAISLPLNLLVDKKDSTGNYATLTYALSVPAGSTKMEIALKPDMFNDNVERISLWVGDDSATYPATIQIVSVKRIIAPYDNSPISNIKIDEVEDGQLYNLMGQPVDKSYKGIKISKSGKKFL